MNLSANATRAAAFLLLIIASACSSSERNVVNASSETFRVYVGMSVQEFLEANKSSTAADREDIWRDSISENHSILYWDRDSSHSVLIPNVGGDAGSATTFALDHHFRDVEGGHPTISAVTLYLGNSLKPGIERSFEDAHQFCEAAIKKLDQAGWSGNTEEFYKKQASLNGWGSYEELIRRLPNEPIPSGFDVDQRTLRNVTAGCSIERNNYIARDLGFADGQTANGNDPKAKMYVAVLSFFSK